MQPAVTCLVAPLHTLFLRMRIIRPHAPMTKADLTSVSVSIPGLSDPQNLERRRQIALKALSERLSKTNDPSRQKLLPKSLPTQQTMNFARGHPGDHRHQHVPHMTFEIPAIPLPPPPPATTTSPSDTTLAGVDHTTIDLLQ